MHPDSKANELVALDPEQVLVVENYGAGVALLRPDVDEDARYVLTELGHAELAAARREEAMGQLFGPWPTVAEVMATRSRDNVERYDRSAVLEAWYERTRDAAVVVPPPADIEAPAPQRGIALEPLERQVAQLIADGRSTREIAQALRIDPASVVEIDLHVRQKLGAASREDVRRLLTARCPACGQGQDTSDCATREHWGVA